MPDDSVRVRLDPLNPGQFFACCGLFELLAAEEQDLLSWFDLDPGRPRVASFCIQSGRGEEVPGAALRILKFAEFSFPDEKPDVAVRPVALRLGESTLEMDWWLDEFREKTTNIKGWAGQVTTQRLFSELLPLIDAESTCEDLFDRSSSTKSLFGVDPRSAWNTLDLGFSPNEHGIPSRVFPAVEILAAVGLQFFRPDFRDRSSVNYSLWGEPLPTSVARLAAFAPWDGLPRSDFVFEICKRGSYKYFSFARKAEKEKRNQ